MVHKNFRLKSGYYSFIVFGVLFLLGGIFSPVYADGIIINDGLVAYYPFDGIAAETISAAKTGTIKVSGSYYTYYNVYDMAGNKVSSHYAKTEFDVPIGTYKITVNGTSAIINVQQGENSLSVSTVNLNGSDYNYYSVYDNPEASGNPLDTIYTSTTLDIFPGTWTLEVNGSSITKIFQPGQNDCSVAVLNLNSADYNHYATVYDTPDTSEEPLSTVYATDKFDLFPGTYTIVINDAKKTLTLYPGENQFEQNLGTDLNADFIRDPTCGELSLTVKFIDKSNGNPISWKWDFNNDGVIDSEDQNPTWKYEQIGTYTVSLTVSNGVNTDKEIKSNYINVKEADLNTGPVAYYPFDGNANDESGNGNHGTVYGATLTEDHFGELNNAYNFDGTDDYIGIPDSPSLNPTDQITVTAWYYWYGSGDADQFIVSKHGSSDSDAQYEISKSNYNKFRAHIYAGDKFYFYDGVTDVSQNKWYFVAMVYNGNELKLYVNANPDISKNVTGLIKTTGNPLWIGKRATAEKNRQVKGKIDEVRIYNRALSDVEIKKLYGVEAIFAADQIAGIFPLTVQFTDLSIGNPTSWKWDFNNDGTIDSEEQNPTWTYQQEGTYTVSLTVSDGTSQNTVTKTDYITVTVTQPNLTASELKIPPSATSLTQPEISWQIKNTSQGAAGKVTDRLYLSSDKILDEKDRLLTRTEGMNAGTDYWRTEKIQIPGDVTPGSYYIILKTDSNGVINETDEDDNIAVQPITIASAKLMTATPDRITLNLNPGVPVTGKIAIGNISSNAISGLAYTVQNAAANITVNLSDVPAELESMASQEITYTVTASDLSVSENEATVLFTSNDRGTADITFAISVIPGQPRLATNPAYLEYGMLRGRKSAYEFELSNTGGASADNLQVLVPQAPWLKLVTPANIGTLAPGGKIKIGLMLSPPENMVLGPYKGVMLVKGSNTGIRIGFSFIAVSEAKGSLKITATDEFTYFAEDKPNVAGAKVRVNDAFSDKIIAEGVTGENGIFSAENINEGRYELEVTAEKHGTYRNTIEIVPGTVKDIEAFLARQLVTYRWSVEPVQIEDRYTVTLEAVFETHVPAPIVTVDPPFNFVPLFEGETTTIEVTVTNHGLIAAQGVTFHPFENDRIYAEPEIQNIGTLAPMTSVTIPVKVSAKIGARSKTDEQPDAECLSGCVKSYYYCGQERTNYACIMLKVVMDILGKLASLSDPIEAGLKAAESFGVDEKATNTIRTIRDSIKCATIMSGNVGAIKDCLSATCGAVNLYNSFVEDMKDKLKLNPVPKDASSCLCAISSIVNLADSKPELSTIPNAGNTAKDIAVCLCSLKLTPITTTVGGGGGGWIGGDWALGGISGPGGYIELKDPCK